MKRSFALLRRTASELALLAIGLDTVGWLASRGAWLLAGVALLLVVDTLGVALRRMRRAGTLRLAWNCPRVDALGLPLPRSEPAREACRAAETVLAQLEQAGRYRAFFPNARRDLRAALVPALVRGAPERAAQLSTHALHRVTEQLHALQPAPTAPDPSGTLLGLQSRAQALASAVEEVAPAPKGVHT